MPTSLSPVDLSIKKTCLGDAIKIAKMSDKKRQALLNYKTYIKISNEQNPTTQEFNKIKEIFYSLCLIKNKKYLTNGQFVKLNESLKLTKNDLTILL